MEPAGVLLNGYLWEADLVRFAFIVGLVLAVAFYERYHVTTGSLIVPAYFGIFVLQPMMILVTLFNAYLTFRVVYHVLPRYTLIYGRAKFLVLVPTSIALQVTLLELSGEHAFAVDRQPFLVGVGYIVPAMIAHDFGRQGVGTTMTAIGAVALLMASIILTLTLVAPSLRATAPLSIYTSLAFELKWVTVAIFCSAMAATALGQTYGYKSGGFVGSAYLALVSNNLLQIAFIIAIAAITYVIVVKLLMRHAILFGRRKFAAILLVGGMLAWIGLSIGDPLFGLSALPFAALPLSGIVVPSLFANDAERVGPMRVIQGTTLNVLFTLSTTLLVQELAESGNTARALELTLLVAVSAVLVFGRYLQLARTLFHAPSREGRLAPLWARFNHRPYERVALPSEQAAGGNVVNLDPSLFEEPAHRGS